MTNVKVGHYHRKRKRRAAAPVGGVFIALALIGAVTVIVVCIRFTVSFLDNEKDKKMFADIILPVAMFDPPPFNDVQEVDMLDLLRYSMWANLKSEKRSSYKYLDTNEVVIPASDLDVAAANLFGPDIELAHQTFGVGDMSYLYNPEDGTYNVPVSEQMLVYEPQVEEITKVDKHLSLTVAYIPPATAWTEAGGPLPDKYMIFIMEKTENGYRILKVQDPPRESDDPLEGPIYS